MPEKVRWGILGAAKIAIKKVVPGMQRGQWSDVVAIASRDIRKAQAAAKEAKIPRAFGSYEELLADPSIEAIYNPLPNHLHIPWSVKALEAGKHVLCEKPLAMNAAEVRALIAARDRSGKKAGEAFMVRTHPHWIRAGELARGGKIGKVLAVAVCFSYDNHDATNIRNIPETGGGALMDIGCYSIFAAREIFGQEPLRVVSLIERDPEFKTDRLTSALMEFPGGHATFTCSTQMVPYQRVQILGTRGRIEIEIPFNAPVDRPCRIFIDDGRDVFGGGITVETFPTCDQYEIQGEAFSRAIRENTEVPVPLEVALGNMAVIDAVLRSAESGRWEKPEL
ncbi:MAG TPA: Gfo/Idh/MocA family oxidoreductase [Verrucomicrobiae bacterium]|nr:Gfo/Idh/MocA family oxidoreductase [Verrucomicrobiae bacterium]